MASVIGWTSLGVGATLPPLESIASEPLWLAHLTLFVVAATACIGATTRLNRIEDDETRRGLAWLLLTSGGWALALAGVVLVPDPDVEYALHVVGLIVGLSTLGPWLYFCSAFTGRSLHRDRRLRRLAVGTFALIVLVKLTNPVHGAYFRTIHLESPFPHLAFQPEILHWLIMGLAYVLAAIGYFMLFELFAKTDVDTRPFAVLVAITGLPVFLDVIALNSDALLTINYEPLGVAVFAVGVFGLYVDQMQAIQFTGGRSEPVIALDEADRVRDTNANARALFPALDDGLGEPFADVVPELATKLEDGDVLTVTGDEGARYYRVSSNPFSADAAPVGRLVLLDDVTEREQYRRELERQNERLEQFASMVSHDLRNPLNVASLRLESAQTDDENVDIAADALDRMEGLIEDVLALARQGQPIDDPEPVSIADTVRAAWVMVNSPAAELVVDEDVTLLADPDRLQQLFENLFRNAIEHGGESVTLTVAPLADGTGFFVADDGTGIPVDDRETVFGLGYSTNQDGTGFGLAIVREIVEAHHWEIRVRESASGGARFEIRGVEMA